MFGLHKGDTRQFAAQIGGVGGAVGGVVQQGIDIVEDVPFGDWRLGDWRLGDWRLAIGDWLISQSPNLLISTLYSPISGKQNIQHPFIIKMLPVTGHKLGGGVKMGLCAQIF